MTNAQWVDLAEDEKSRPSSGRIAYLVAGLIFIASPPAHSEDLRSVSPEVAPSAPVGAEILTTCAPSYCGSIGQVVLESWRLPNCGNDCGTETWYIKNAPARVLAYSIFPTTTTGSNSTKITLLLSHSEIGTTKNIEIGARCSGSGVNCLSTRVSVTVIPVISCAPSDPSDPAHIACPKVWWFNNEQPTYYLTALQAAPAPQAAPASGNKYVWNFAAGQTYARFSLQKGNTVEVKAISDPGNGTPPPVSVTVTVTNSLGTATSAPFILSMRKPYKLVPRKGPCNGVAAAAVACDEVDLNRGYLSKIYYEVRDQTGALLPYNVYINEKFTGAPTNIYPNTNWAKPENCGTTHLCPLVDPSDFWDEISGAGALTPKPQVPESQSPQNQNLGSACDDNKDGITCVDSYDGFWAVGGPDPGDGVKVQNNTWLRFRDHGRHTNIVSPPP